MRPVLDIRDLRTHFVTIRGVGKAVDGVDVSLAPGETLGVVGESGSGKTMLALSVLGLAPRPGRVVAGAALYRARGAADAVDLLAMSEEALRGVRGKGISMIFQEPMTSLNPVFRVGEQVAEALTTHTGASRAQALAAAVEMLAQVGIPQPERRAMNYPHELSGGMRQRVMIAMALILGPDVILADEPTTALDVTIQAEILELMGRLQRQRGTALLLITHNLGVVAQSCDRVAVMYAGKVVEQASTLALFDAPLHPYTRLLLASVPRMGRREPLAAIGGLVPNLMDLPPGCCFHPRCPHAFDKCRAERPPLFHMKQSGQPVDRFVRCWLHRKDGAA